jgi:hypothetical protein
MFADQFALRICARGCGLAGLLLYSHNLAAIRLRRPRLVRAADGCGPNATIPRCRYATSIGQAPPGSIPLHVGVSERARCHPRTRRLIAGLPLTMARCQDVGRAATESVYNRPQRPGGQNNSQVRLSIRANRFEARRWRTERLIEVDRLHELLADQVRLPRQFAVAAERAPRDWRRGASASRPRAPAAQLLSLMLRLFVSRVHGPPLSTPSDLSSSASRLRA